MTSKGAPREKEKWNWVPTFNPHCRLFKLQYEDDIKREDWGAFFYDENRSGRFLISVYIDKPSISEQYLYRFGNSFKLSDSGKPGELIAENRFFLFDTVELAEHFVKTHKNFNHSCGRIYELKLLLTTPPPQEVDIELVCFWHKNNGICEFEKDSIRS
jgi:hypothetical protein